MKMKRGHVSYFPRASSVWPNPQVSDSPLLRKLETIKHLVGNTPLFPIKSVFSRPNVQLYCKMEWRQFGGSVKSRPAFNIIQQAIRRGDLNPDKIILDASSGNTGIAYAHIASALGLRIKLCMPESATIERKRLLKMLGVELVLTDSDGGTTHSREVAMEIAAADPDLYYYADQYSNNDNWSAHFGTAEEILQQTNQEVTHFTSSLGTCGTFVGAGRRFKAFDSGIQLVSLQPDDPDHKLEGWKHLASSSIPEIYDPELADDTIFVNTEAAYKMIADVARYEGMLISPSSAANLVGSIQLAEQLDSGVVVTIFTDNYAKYSAVYDEVEAKHGLLHGRGFTD